MVLKVEIKKIINTCIMLDSVLFKPLETKGDIDYYELPCEFQQNHDIKVIHYAGNSFNGIEAVIDRNGNGVFKSVIKEIKSFSIDLYYCEMTASFTVTKQNAFLHFEVSQTEGKDFIGCFSHCDMHILQHKNIEISDCVYHFYPSKRIKRLVFFIENFSTVLAFIFYLIALPFAIDYYVDLEKLHNPGEAVGVYPYITFIPLTVAIIVLLFLDIKRISKHTLKIDK